MKKTSSLLLAAGLFAISALPSQAGLLNFNSDTVGGFTFNRPTAEADYPLTPDQVSLSDIGDNVAYFAQPFTVSLAGLYDFSAISAEFDTYIVLYTTFDPALPASHVIAVNDDAAAGGSTNSGLSGITLSAGTQYTFVTTGFANIDLGSATSSISGPGTITAVPEPRETALVLIAAVGVLVIFRMRRRAQQS